MAYIVLDIYDPHNIKVLCKDGKTIRIQDLQEAEEKIKELGITPFLVYVPDTFGEPNK